MYTVICIYMIFLINTFDYNCIHVYIHIHTDGKEEQEAQGC